jgi:tryptophan synthase alpha chain
MNIKLLFEQLSKVDIKNSQATHLLMGYLNPVLQYGVNEFCKHASELGIDGVIIPDLPLQEFIDEYKTIFEKYHLKNIFLITPQTSESRIRLIDKHSNAFIYIVSSTSTTGVKAIVKTEQENYFKRILAMKLNNPLMIGFGISDNTSFNKVCEYANGAIIGSAFINAINNSTNLKKDVNDFVSTILKPKIER